jgi:hypothetical protein
MVELEELGGSPDGKNISNDVFTIAIVFQRLAVSATSSAHTLVLICSF